MREKKLTQAEKEYANSLNLEWLRLSNKVLRAFPGSPRQRELKSQLEKTQQYKSN